VKRLSKNIGLAGADCQSAAGCQPIGAKIRPFARMKLAVELSRLEVANRNRL